MPNLTRINERVTARIDGSSLTLTVVYPPIRPVAAGTSPGVAPVNPLSGPAATEVVFPAEPTGYKTNVTVKCLWLDALSSSSPDGTRRVLQGGWVDGATAMARVLARDVAVDTTNPEAGTIFDAADHVVFLGTRYRVLQVTPVGASFGPPVSYHVWLVGIRRV